MNTKVEVTEFGKWHWYFGTDETDDIMSGMWDSREEVIAQGRKAMGADSFYIIEGRTNALHEYEICNDEREFAPFAETRNGEWITPQSGEPT